MTRRSRQPWRGVLKDKVVSAGRVPPAAQTPWPGQKKPAARVWSQPPVRDDRERLGRRRRDAGRRCAVALDVGVSTTGSSAATAPEIPQME
jgi:hypothetical protein